MLKWCGSLRRGHRLPLLYRPFGRECVLVWRHRHHFLCSQSNASVCVFQWCPITGRLHCGRMAGSQVVHTRNATVSVVFATILNTLHTPPNVFYTETSNSLPRGKLARAQSSLLLRPSIVSNVAVGLCWCWCVAGHDYQANQVELCLNLFQSLICRHIYSFAVSVACRANMLTSTLSATFPTNICQSRFAIDSA